MPDQVKRVGSKGKPKPNTINAESDFTLPLEFSNPTTVDTGNQSPSAQDGNQLDIKNQNQIQNKSDTQANTHVDLMKGIHHARDVLDEVELIKASGKQDALGHRVPHPDSFH